MWPIFEPGDLIYKAACTAGKLSVSVETRDCLIMDTEYGLADDHILMGEPYAAIE